MKSVLKSGMLPFSLLAVFSACEADRPAISIMLTPNTANLYITQSLQFTARVYHSTNMAVTWSLSGAGCSGITCGTISSTGLYTTPVSVPIQAIVKVKATSVADPSKSATATITILAAVDVWTWISGSNEAYQAGVYGTKGIADPANVPGARYAAISWVDSNGVPWLFGGDGFGSAGNSGFLNDLWKYDPASNKWTWISGSDVGYQPGVYGTKGLADPANVPGARFGAVSWIDPSGRLWLFGGFGYYSAENSGLLNDLWKYDPNSNEWTWVSGSNEADQAGTYGIKGIADPANVPGARDGAVSGADSSGQLWLFGGVGYDSAGQYRYLNDLWKYDTTSNEWTWVSGSNEGDQVGIYGTRGVAAPLNIPGGKWGAVSWLDPDGQLWLFGGDGVYMPGNSGELNDLWRYNPISNEWTWISGSSDAYQPGTYGTQGIAAPSNVPGARCEAESLLDSSGNLWLFGGVGYDSAGQFADPLNDLWKYEPSVQEWTWVSGSDTRCQAGIYGTRGVSDPSNVPGARYAALSWFDSSGSIWLFGGKGFQYSDLSDLWRYTR